MTSGWSGVTPYLTSPYGVGRRSITSTSIPKNPNARGLTEEEEEDFLSSIVHFILCIRHLFTWGIRLLLQDPLPLGDGQRQVLDSTCRTAGLDYRHGETAAGRGGSRTIPLLMSPPSASSAEARKAKVEEDEMVAEEEGVEEERKRRPAPLP